MNISGCEAKGIKSQYSFVTFQSGGFNVKSTFRFQFYKRILNSWGFAGLMQSEQIL